MTDLEKRAVESLAGCKLPWSIWHGKFARELYALSLRKPEAVLTVNQSAGLWRLCWRYRRQIKDLQVVMRAQSGEGIGPSPLYFDFDKEVVQDGR